MTTSENETNEEVIEEEVILDEDIDLDPVTDALFREAKVGKYRSNEDDRNDVSTDGEEIDTPEESVDDGVTSTEDENVDTTDVSSPLFTLDDGTEVTLEEAQKGYSRQKDYTQKTQALAEERKQVEQNKALIDYITNDPALRQKVIDHMSGNNTPTPDAKPPGIELPENYKDDPFVTQLVAVVNELKGDVTQVKGGYQNITQETKAKQEQSAFQTKLYSRLEPAYTELKGQVETPPTPQEFTQAIQAYFTENNIDPAKGAQQIANGVDPNYLPGIVARIYSDDILKSTQAETKVVEKQRKKRTAKGATLRVAGKSNQAPKPSLPKLPSGKLDGDAVLRNIILEQEKMQRG